MFKKGKIFKLIVLLKILFYLVEKGLDDFYKGELVEKLVVDLVVVGLLICFEDFYEYEVKCVMLLLVDISKGKIFNLFVLI